MNAQRLQALRRAQGYHLLAIKPGMMLEIHEKIGEGNSQRIWKFKGLVIKVKKPNHADGTFTIRGKTSGNTIEKIYPLSFVSFEHVYLLDLYKVARAKLYYIREKIGKDAKMKSLITAEQRGTDLLKVAKELITAEMPAVAMVADEEVIEEAVADEIVEQYAQNASPEADGQKIVTEEIVQDVEEAATEETVEEVVASSEETNEETEKETA